MLETIKYLIFTCWVMWTIGILVTSGIWLYARLNFEWYRAPFDWNKHARNAYVILTLAIAYYWYG